MLNRQKIGGKLVSQTVVPLFHIQLILYPSALKKIFDFNKSREYINFLTIYQFFKFFIVDIWFYFNWQITYLPCLTLTISPLSINRFKPTEAPCFVVIVSIISTTCCVVIIPFTTINWCINRQEKSNNLLLSSEIVSFHALTLLLPCCTSWRKWRLMVCWF